MWVATLVASVLAPLLRWRRAGPEERQQLKWLAFMAIASLLTAAAGLVLTAIGAERTVADLFLLAAVLGLGLGVPVAVGVAILKHRPPAPLPSSSWYCVTAPSGSWPAAPPSRSAA